MTATGVSARPRPPRTAPASRAAAVRLLRLELRRNSAIWLLPLLAAVFWVDTYRDAMSVFPVWGLRGAVLPDHIVKDFAGFAAGIAAWTGSREGRRGAADLVRGTARPGWLRQGATLAATTSWVMAAYVLCLAVLYGVTASQGAWGSPPWWPAAAGAAAVTATCAVGFAAGVFWPSRFTAPVAAVGLVVLILAGTSLDRSPYARGITPGAANLTPDTGSFYPYLPGQAIAQVIFLGGITITVAGVLGLVAPAGGRLLRGAAAIVTAAGLAATGTAVGLAGATRQGPEGVIIPALHDAASDRPVPYTPVCGAGPVPSIPMCLHPAFRAYLPELDSTFGPVFREVVGLPGAPVRVVQISGLAGGNPGGQLGGTPPVYRFALQSLGPRGIAGLQENFIVVFIAGNNAGNDGTPAQQAVWLGLLEATGYHPDTSWLPPQVTAAATRFAALPPAARHAWLAAHLPALRARHITLEQIP